MFTITPQQHRLLQKLSDGFNLKEAARAIGISHRTAEQHMADARRRNDCPTTIALIAKWIDRGFRE